MVRRHLGSCFIEVISRPGLLRDLGGAANAYVRFSLAACLDDVTGFTQVQVIEVVAAVIGWHLLDLLPETVRLVAAQQGTSTGRAFREPKDPCPGAVA